MKKKLTKKQNKINWKMKRLLCLKERIAMKKFKNQTNKCG